jgi:gamma-glutamylputrescine oxidase
LSTALHLARRGIKAVVLEQALIGWGASGRNGGQVHVGQRRDQYWLENHLGLDAARALWALGIRAREHLDWLIDTYSIDCDLRLGLLHADHKQRYVRSSRDHVDHLNREYGYEHIRFVDRDEMRSLIASDDYFGGTLDTRGGHLHALNLALGIGRAAHSHGATLYEDAEVLRINRTKSGWQMTTERGDVRADNVVLACNGYMRGLSRTVEAHVMPINNFIAVTEPLGETGANALLRNGYAVSDSRFVIYYFRTTADHRLLFGGGENYSSRFPSNVPEFVHKHIRRIFPQLASVRLDYAWGGTLAVTPNRMPFIRQLEPGLFNASGYSGMGVVLGPYMGRVLADAIAGERAEFDLMSSVPVPRFPGGVKLRAPTLAAAMSLAALRDNL